MTSLSEEVIAATLAAHREVVEDEKGDLNCICGHALGGDTLHEEFERYNAHLSTILWKLFKDSTKVEWGVDLPREFYGSFGRFYGPYDSESSAERVLDFGTTLDGPEHASIVSRRVTDWEPREKKSPMGETPNSKREAAKLQVELLEELGEPVPDELRELANPAPSNKNLEEGR